jgi:hypothetical protein
MNCELRYFERQFEPFQHSLEDGRNQETYSQVGGPAALCPPGRFLLLISVTGRVDPRTIVRMEGLGKLKKNPSHWDSNPRPSGL